MTKRELLYQVKQNANLMTWNDLKLARTDPREWGELLQNVKLFEERLERAKIEARKAGINEADIEAAESAGTDYALDAMHGE